MIVEFHALAMPCGTYTAILAGLNSEISRTLAVQDLSQQLAQRAAEQAPASQAETRRHVLTEQAEFEKVVKQIGLDPTD